MMGGDTIVAIATPIGMGGVGIIRLSGPDSRRLVRPFVGQRLLRHAQMNLVHLCDPDGAMIDMGYVVWFQSPRSFTGEDIVELHLHGGPHLLQKMLMLLCQQGARLAVRGEFTKRAFLNGKMDLSQAEAIIDLIEAKSDVAHSVAIGHHQGKLYSYIQAARSTLMHLLEHIEASIDFPDEVDGIDPIETKECLQGVLGDLHPLMRTGDWGKWVQGGIRCVLVGKPNVGKSALLNALTGEARSIVSDIPGTTRDYITMTTTFNGFLIEWTDTAGLRDTAHTIEKEGIDRSKEQMQQADIILLVFDHSKLLTDEDRAVIATIQPSQKGLILLNKQDLPNVVESVIGLKWPIISVSAKTGVGVGVVLDHIYQLIQTTIDHQGMDLLCNARQSVAIREAISSIEALLPLIGQVMDDLLVIDLRRAVLKLGEVTGESLTEEMLDGIFSRFCIGK